MKRLSLVLSFIFITSFSSCLGNELEGGFQFHQLNLGQGAVFVSDHINFVTKETKGKKTETVLHGIAESFGHVTEIVTAKDKKKKKKGFWKLLCVVFNTVIQLMAHYKDPKKSYDTDMYNHDVATLTYNFLALLKYDQPQRTFTASPSYLYQFSFLKDRAHVEAAVSRVMKSAYKEVLLAELFDELEKFLHELLV